VSWTSLVGVGAMAFFGGEAQDNAATPRSQLEEGIDAAAFVDPFTLADLHPLDVPVLRRWAGGERGFHLHTTVLVRADGTQDYRFAA
jgi:hypothetical protein